MGDSDKVLVLIDNYDSFTFNLAQYLGELKADVSVHRNDALAVSDVVSMKPDAVVVSPGPCGPERAGICPELTLEAARLGIPLLGVCLGHQVIGHVFGGSVVRCHEIVHGKTNAIRHVGTGLFAALPDPFTATRYHSLIVERNNLPDVLEITAWTEDGTVMGLRHKERPIHGVQFHPESIASECGHAILQAFLNAAEEHKWTT